MSRSIRRLLIANRSEIAIRVMRAAAELDIRTIAIYANEDRFALHRFKADESYLVGAGKKPIAAYLDIEDILRVAREAKGPVELVVIDDGNHVANNRVYKYRTQSADWMAQQLGLPRV